MSSELVSTIIPVKNEVKRIRGVVQNLVSQTYRPIEVLVVDGGSTDGTLEVIKSLTREHSSGEFEIRLLREGDYSRSSSLPNARNIGVTNARGNYVAFFDADFELVDRSAIKKIAEGLTKDEHVAISYIPNMHTWIEKNLVLDDIAYYFGGSKPLHVNCAFRKEVFSRATFDPDLGFREDFDFLQRVKTNYSVLETEARRCYPHTLRELVRQQLWYGRTAPRYSKKACARSWWLNITRSNAVLGMIILIPFLALFDKLAILISLLTLTTLITYRWLRKDARFFGRLNVKGLLERFLWLLLRETLGRFFFDLGLIKGLVKKRRVEVGR